MVKLDAVIDLLFNYYDTVFCKPQLPGSKEIDRKDAFERLLQIFVSTMLSTYNSRHLQFVLFRFSQIEPDFLELFTDTLLSFPRNASRHTHMAMN